MRPTYWIAFLSLVLATSCRTASDSAQASTDPNAPVIEVVVLEYAEADEVAAALEDLLADATAGSEQAPKVRADARTNSLLLHARPEALAELKDLIAQLDVEAVGAAPEAN